MEIERKFLVQSDAWRGHEPGTRYRQGYLSTDPERTVRVRLAGNAGFLTVKGRNVGASRFELEVPIPAADAEQLLEQLCLRPIIDKTRYRIPHAGFIWEVDEFHGVNAGLIVAEVELEHEGQSVDLPGWVGREVTGEPRYYNANLVAAPFGSW